MRGLDPSDPTLCGLRIHIRSNYLPNTNCQMVRLADADWMRIICPTLVISISSKILDVRYEPYMDNRPYKFMKKKKQINKVSNGLKTSASGKLEILVQLRMSLAQRPSKAQESRN